MTPTHTYPASVNCTLIPAVFYKINTKYITISQNTTTIIVRVIKEILITHFVFQLSAQAY